ncbi:hypothetical protein D915_005323 [Fasciola hepatica]|uniref:Uncharacterized protein n=1 Tax=Fasciola hepatica TaxID=6192 RepID=A0A4E0RBQ3_FASHE|nr:hypothetical protein D915_005323 [Fasciola hepatica]
MRLQLPDYVMNRNLIKAVNKNNVAYVKGVLDACPWLRNALFYKEAIFTSVGLFEQTYRPPVLCLFTPFAHAILQNSKTVMKALKIMQVDMYHPCYVADVLEEDTLSYRVLELPPIALCRPDDPGLSSAVECGYDIHGNIMIVTTIYRGNHVEDAVVQYRGYWEFCLGVNKRNQNAQAITELTKRIILSGYDINILLKQLDLCKLLARYYHLTLGQGFRSMDDLTLACELIQTLIRNGSSLSDPSVTHNMYKALVEVVNSENHSNESFNHLSAILRSVVLLTADAKIWRELKSPMLDGVIRSAPRDTLTMLCVRYIRSLLGGQFFQRHVQSLPCNDETKSLISNGLKVEP